MSKKVLIRKQAGGGLQYQVTQEGSRPRVPFMQNLAAVRGGARGLVTDPNTNNVRQGFIPGAELGAAKPTGMQRLAAGANVAGTGLAAALTGLQTLYGLQGGNIGALASAKDQFRANVGGLTGGSPTEAQETQNIGTKAFNEQQQTMAQNAVMQQATPAGLPAQTPDATTDASRIARLSGPPGSVQRAWKDSGNFGFAPPGWTPSAVQQPAVQQPAAPAPTAPAPVDSALAQAVNAVSVPLPENNSLGTATGNMPVQQPQQTSQQYGSTPPPLPPGYAPNYTGAKVTPLGANPRTPVSGQTDAEGYKIVGAQQTGVPDPFQNVNWQQPQQRIKSFATYVLDEFGDMLHKADPHVAGLLAFRVYMDKIMR